MEFRFNENLLVLVVVNANSIGFILNKGIAT